MQLLEPIFGQLSAFTARRRKSRPAYTPTPLARLRALMRDQPSFAGLLPYAAYDDDRGIFHNEDSIGFVLEAPPLTGADETIARTLSGLYVNCPAHAGIQFILYRSPNLVADLKRYANLRQPDRDALTFHETEGRAKRNENIFRALARRRIDYLSSGVRRSLFNHTSYLLGNFRLIVSVTLPLTKGDGDVETLTAMRDTFSQSLTAAYMPPVRWNAADLIAFCREVLNPHAAFTDEGPAYDPGRLIKEQIVFPDTICRIGESGLRIGNQQREVAMRFMSVHNYPRDMGLWDMGSLIGDPVQNALQYPYPFVLALNVHVLEYESAKGKATVKSARATQNADSVMARFLPDLREKKHDWDIVMASLAEGQRLVALNHQVVVFCDPAGADLAEQQAKAIARTKGFDVANDVYMQPQALFSLLPMSLSRDLYADLKVCGRVSTKTGDNAAHMAPVIGEWAGTRTPTVLLFGRRGQIMYIDLFDNDKGNFNGAVAGASGTGKSVFLNDLSLSHHAAGAVVRIIDVGRSYEKTCKIVGGQYVEFKPDEAIVINPFPLVKDITEEIELLKPMLLQMAFPKQRPTDYDAQIMTEAILDAWKAHGTQTTVSRIAATLKEMAKTPNGFDQRIHDLGRMLYPYTAEGQYGRYFEGAPNVNFRSDYVVLELEDLSKKQDLQTVVLLIMIFFIQQDIFLSARDRKKLILIDEAWQLIGAGGTTAEFIEKAYRRARKHGAAILVASQSVNDFYMSDGRSPILDNADWLFLLRQKSEALEQLAKSGRIAMNEGLKRMLTTVKTEQGKYSEVFIHSTAGTGIGRLLLDPFSLLCYSTKAEDYEAYRRYAEQGLSTSAALDQVLKDRGLAR